MCPKCGNANSFTQKKYCPGGMMIGICSTIKKEHIHRTCTNCGYEKVVNCWDDDEGDLN